MNELEQATMHVWKKVPGFEPGPVLLLLEEMSVVYIECHASFVVDGLNSPEDFYIYVDLFSEMTNEELAFDTNYFKVKINGEDTVEEIERQVSNILRMDLITEKLINRENVFSVRNDSF